MRIWHATQIADRSKNGEAIPVEQLSEATRVLTDAYRGILEDNAAPPSQAIADASEMKGRWVNGYFIADSYDFTELAKIDFPHGPIFVPK